MCSCGQSKDRGYGSRDGSRALTGQGPRGGGRDTQGVWYHENSNIIR
jgi:hypothetical protein